MKLIARCPGCQQKVELDNKASDRGELKTYIGSDQVDVECSDCGESFERHINHIQAQVDYKIVILAIALGVLATVVLWQFYGAISTVLCLFPILFWIRQESQKHSFNEYLLKRK